MFFCPSGNVLCVYNGVSYISDGSEFSVPYDLIARHMVMSKPHHIASDHGRNTLDDRQRYHWIHNLSKTVFITENRSRSSPNDSIAEVFDDLPNQSAAIVKLENKVNASFDTQELSSSKQFYNLNLEHELGRSERSIDSVYMGAEEEALNGSRRRRGRSRKLDAEISRSIRQTDAGRRPDGMSPSSRTGEVDALPTSRWSNSANVKLGTNPKDSSSWTPDVSNGLLISLQGDLLNNSLNGERNDTLKLSPDVVYARRNSSVNADRERTRNGTEHWRKRLERAVRERERLERRRRELAKLERQRRETIEECVKRVAFMKTKQAQLAIAPYAGGTINLPCYLWLVSKYVVHLPFNLQQFSN